MKNTKKRGRDNLKTREKRSLVRGLDFNSPQETQENKKSTEEDFQWDNPSTVNLQEWDYPSTVNLQEWDDPSTVNSPQETQEVNKSTEKDLPWGNPSTEFDKTRDFLGDLKYPDPIEKDVSIYLKHENRGITEVSESQVKKFASNDQLINLLAEAVHYINENDQSNLSTYINKAEIYRELDDMRFNFLMDIYLYTLGSHYYKKKQAWNYRYHIHKGEVLKKNQQAMNYLYLMDRAEKPSHRSIFQPMTLKHELHMVECTAKHNKLYPNEKTDFESFIQRTKKKYPYLPPLLEEFNQELWNWKIAFKREDPIRFIFMSPYLEKFERLFPNFRDKVRIKEEYRSRELADSEDPEYPNYKNEEEYLNPEFWEGVVIAFRRPGEDTITVRLFNIKAVDPDENELEPAKIEIPIEYVENLGPITDKERNQLNRFELSDYYSNLKDQDPYVL